MTVFDPINAPVDVIFFGAMPTPGLARVVGLTKPKRLDEQAGPGMSGGYLIFRGMKLARWTIEIELYSAADYEAWDRFIAYIREPRVPQPMARMSFDVFHPILAQRGISSAMVEDIKGPEQKQGDSVSTVSLACVEFRLPKLQTSKPDEPQSETEDPMDRKLREAQTQLDDLRGTSNWGGWWK